MNTATADVNDEILFELQLIRIAMQASLKVLLNTEQLAAYDKAVKDLLDKRNSQ